MNDPFWDDKLDKKIAAQTLEKWKKVPCELKLSDQRVKKWELWSKNLPKNSKIALYGGGDHSIRLLDEIKHLKDSLPISFLVDRKPLTHELEGIPVKTPEYLMKGLADFVVISSYFYEKEIYACLLSKFDPKKILRFYELE